MGKVKNIMVTAVAYTVIAVAVYGATRWALGLATYAERECKDYLVSRDVVKWMKYHGVHSCIEDNDATYFIRDGRKVIYRGGESERKKNEAL